MGRLDLRQVRLTGIASVLTKSCQSAIGRLSFNGQMAHVSIEDERIKARIHCNLIPRPKPKPSLQKTRVSFSPFSAS
jgi:hypothetical protein